MTETKEIKKHFIIDIEYINDLAVNIAENVPEQYYGVFCRELRDYLKCAINNEIGSDGYLSTDDDDLSIDSGSELEDEEYLVSKSEDGFYELSDCDVVAPEDVKDCNSVGKEEIKSND